MVHPVKSLREVQVNNIHVVSFVDTTCDSFKEVQQVGYCTPVAGEAMLGRSDQVILVKMVNQMLLYNALQDLTRDGRK